MSELTIKQVEEVSGGNIIMLLWGIDIALDFCGGFEKGYAEATPRKL